MVANDMALLGHLKYSQSNGKSKAFHLSGLAAEGALVWIRFICGYHL